MEVKVDNFIVVLRAQMITSNTYREGFDFTLKLNRKIFHIYGLISFDILPYKCVVYFELGLYHMHPVNSFIFHGEV